MGAADGGAVDFLLEREVVEVGHFEGVNGFDVGSYFDFIDLGENFFCYGAGGDTADGFAGRSTTGTLGVADAVFGLVGEVGVARTVFVF